MFKCVFLFLYKYSICYSIEIFGCFYLHCFALVWRSDDLFLFVLCSHWIIAKRTKAHPPTGLSLCPYVTPSCVLVALCIVFNIFTTMKKNTAKWVEVNLVQRGEASHQHLGREELWTLNGIQPSPPLTELFRAQLSCWQTPKQTKLNGKCPLVSGQGLQSIKCETTITFLLLTSN